jgi:CRISPR/Cas system CSM-associated protein Csm3 (group 7 of RAMP superfamily)
MNTRMTVFKATLVQDSALSVSGLDRESVTDRPFTIVDGVPTLSGRGLKGAAVAMARRFFDPLPQSVSEARDKGAAYRRSAWQFANATPASDGARPRPRAGVGIRHKTGARADGVLHDREVIPAGTRWPLEFRVDWTLAGAEDAEPAERANEAEEAEGILGYILDRHWRADRCWLGGDVARGLGWCHIEDLRAFRLDGGAYERWIESGWKVLPKAQSHPPVVETTKAWCFRTLDLTLTFGEHRPEAHGPGDEDVAWGVDMLAIGPHDAERTIQSMGDGAWSRPAWAAANAPQPVELVTDRAIVMESDRPLLPGSSLRGPLRHAFSRAINAAGGKAEDPHPRSNPGEMDEDDLGGRLFGTVANSSRVLIRDGRAGPGWAAARLHMHAEDEFSAGSYESAKRDSVRLLRGEFPMRIVVEGPDAQSVTATADEIDRLVDLGKLGHLPVGGHKTRGAGWGRWRAAPWTSDDVQKLRCWKPAAESESSARASPNPPEQADQDGAERSQRRNEKSVYVRATKGRLDSPTLTLGEAATHAREGFGQATPVAWWCEPAIDFTSKTPPAVFGWGWPEADTLQIDEVAFFADDTVWRAARTATGIRWVKIVEVGADTPEAREAMAVTTPARLHGDGTRFSAAPTGTERVSLREWHENGQILGFTLKREAD